MLELVAMLSLEVNEKEQAPLGQRIRAVGMCFYKKGDLKKGNNYQLRRNRDNPKDTNCFEVRSRHITMAIKGGGRPTRLLPHAKMLLIPIKLFLSAG